MHVRTFLQLAVVTLVAVPAFAQWMKVPPPQVPLTPDGKPNLSAPAPRLPDGTPIAALDRTDYTHSPDTAYLQRQLERILYPVPVEGMAPGHILLLRIERAPQHMAVVSDLPGGLGLIHAYAPARAVVEHALDAAWRARIATDNPLFPNTAWFTVQGRASTEAKFRTRDSKAWLWGGAPRSHP